MQSISKDNNEDNQKKNYKKIMKIRNDIEI